MRASFTRALAVSAAVRGATATCTKSRATGSSVGNATYDCTYKLIVFDWSTLLRRLSANFYSLVSRTYS